MNDIIVGIDIGTSKVCTLVGKVDKENNLEIIGKGTCNCNGVRKGVIVDIDSTAGSIKSAVAKAEIASNLKIGSAYVNIIGAHVSVMNNRSSISLTSDNREITVRDVDKLISNLKSIDIPEDRQIIDIITRQFIVDGYDEIINPVGMVGTRLEVDADIISGKITSVQNIIKSMEKAGVNIDGIVVEALATGDALLAPDEQEMGVVLIDIGGGVTDISVFKNKRLLYYNSIPVGGDHITNDIAMGLRISHADAEKIKREYNLGLASLIKNDHEITVCDINDGRKKVIKITDVVEIIEARIYEIFSLSREMIIKFGISENLLSNVVLTGRGICYIDGAAQLAEEVYGCKIRGASCKNAGVSQAEYVVAAGIVKYVSDIHKLSRPGSDVRVIKQSTAPKSNNFTTKISNLIKKLF